MPIPFILKYFTYNPPPPSKQAPPVSQKAFDRVGSDLRYEKWLETQQDMIVRARLVVLFAPVLAVKTRLVEEVEESEGSEDGGGSGDSEGSEGSEGSEDDKDSE